MITVPVLPTLHDGIDHCDPPPIASTALSLTLFIPMACGAGAGPGAALPRRLPLFQAPVGSLGLALKPREHAIPLCARHDACCPSWEFLRLSI